MELIKSGPVAGDDVSNVSALILDDSKRSTDREVRSITVGYGEIRQITSGCRESECSSAVVATSNEVAVVVGGVHDTSARTSIDSNATLNSSNVDGCVDRVSTSFETGNYISRHSNGHAFSDCGSSECSTTGCGSDGTVGLSEGVSSSTTIQCVSTSTTGEGVSTSTTVNGVSSSVSGDVVVTVITGDDQTNSCLVHRDGVITGTTVDSRSCECCDCSSVGDGVITTIAIHSGTSKSTLQLDGISVEVATDFRSAIRTTDGQLVNTLSTVDGGALGADSGDDVSVLVAVDNTACDDSSTEGDGIIALSTHEGAVGSILEGLDPTKDVTVLLAVDEYTIEAPGVGGSGVEGVDALSTTDGGATCHVGVAVPGDCITGSMGTNVSCSSGLVNQNKGIDSSGADVGGSSIGACGTRDCVKGQSEI